MPDHSQPLATVHEHPEPSIPATRNNLPITKQTDPNHDHNPTVALTPDNNLPSAVDPNLHANIVADPVKIAHYIAVDY